MKKWDRDGTLIYKGHELTTRYGITLDRKQNKHFPSLKEAKASVDKLYK